MARTPDSGTIGPGSIPLREFCTFFAFSQILRTYFWFQATTGNKRPFAHKTRGFKVPLEVVKTHGVLCHLVDSLVWKLVKISSKIDTFLSFLHT